MLKWFLFLIWPKFPCLVRIYISPDSDSTNFLQHSSTTVTFKFIGFIPGRRFGWSQFWRIDKAYSRLEQRFSPRLIFRERRRETVFTMGSFTDISSGQRTNCHFHGSLLKTIYFQWKLWTKTARNPPIFYFPYLLFLLHTRFF